MGAFVRGVSGDEPDFYFTLFVEFADGRRVVSEGLGRWYVGGVPTLTGGGAEQQLERAVLTELADVEESERWTVLEIALARQHLEVRRDQLTSAPFVIEFHASARKHMHHLEDCS